MVIFHSYVSLPEGNVWPMSQNPVPLVNIKIGGKKCLFISKNMAPLGFDLSPKQCVEVNCQSLVGMEKENGPKISSINMFSIVLCVGF